MRFVTHQNLACSPYITRIYPCKMKEVNFDLFSHLCKVFLYAWSRNIVGGRVSFKLKGIEKTESTDTWKWGYT